MALLLTVWVSTTHAHPGESTRIDQLTHLIEAQPAEQALHILRAAEHTRAQSWVAARHDFNLAETLGEPAAVGFELGKFHYLRAEYPQAYSQFSRYLQHVPSAHQAILYQARTAAKSGDVAVAVTHYSHYFEKSSAPHPGDFVAAASSLESVGDVEQGLKRLDDGLMRLGMNAQLQRYAVSLETKVDRPLRAVARWQQLESVLGRSSAWCVRLAELHLAAGQLEEMRHWLTIADEQLVAKRTTVAGEVLRAQISALRQSAPIKLRR